MSARDTNPASPQSPIQAGRGIAFRLSALVLSVVGVIFVAMSTATYFMAREALL